MGNANTSQASLATLTEEELFAEFLKSKIAIADDCYPNGFYEVEAAELLQHNGLFIRISGLCPSGIEDPLFYLSEVCDELSFAEGAVTNAYRAFSALMDERRILPEEPDAADSEAHAAWRKAYDEARHEPRYSSSHKPAPTPRETVISEVLKALKEASERDAQSTPDLEDAKRLLEQIESSILRSDGKEVTYRPRRQVWVVQQE